MCHKRWSNSRTSNFNLSSTSIYFWHLISTKDDPCLEFRFQMIWYRKLSPCPSIVQSSYKILHNCRTVTNEGMQNLADSSLMSSHVVSFFLYYSYYKFTNYDVIMTILRLALTDKCIAIFFIWMILVMTWESKGK